MYTNMPRSLSNNFRCHIRYRNKKAQSKMAWRLKFLLTNNQKIKYHSSFFKSNQVYILQMFITYSEQLKILFTKYMLKKKITITLIVYIINARNLFLLSYTFLMT